MKCKACGKPCTAMSDSSTFQNRAVSNCCKADIVYIQHNNIIDYSKDAMQGNWHNFPTSGSVTGYSKEFKTLRDEIAIAAMQSLILTKWCDNIPFRAYELSDAMLLERDK